MINPTTLQSFVDELRQMKVASSAAIGRMIQDTLHPGGALKPSMYAHIKDAPKAIGAGKSLAMKSLGGGRVGGAGKAVIGGLGKVL